MTAYIVPSRAALPWGGNFIEIPLSGLSSIETVMDSICLKLKTESSFPADGNIDLLTRSIGDWLLERWGEDISVFVTGFQSILTADQLGALNVVASFGDAMQDVLCFQASDDSEYTKSGGARSQKSLVEGLFRVRVFICFE